MAPAPLTAEMAIGAATVKLNYDRTTGQLRYEAVTTSLAATDRVVGLAVHRSEADKPGPVVAHLLAPNQISGAGTLVMRGREREDLVAGRLFVEFYTRQQPLGVGRRKIELR